MAVETWIIADTDTHYGAVITTTGQQLDAARFPTSPAGYLALAWFITGHGRLLRAGIEGINAYGAGLAPPDAAPSRPAAR